MKAFLKKTLLALILTVGASALAAQAEASSKTRLLNERANAVAARRNALAAGALASAGIPYKTVSGVPVSIEWAGSHCLVRRLLVAPGTANSHRVTFVTSGGNLELSVN